MIGFKISQMAVLVAVVFAVASACSSPAVTVLNGVTVIDGVSGRKSADQAIIIRGDRIAEIGAVGSIKIPNGAEVMDLSGLFLVPGFVDLHVHFPEDASVHQAMLDRLLEYGVTTILNPGARPGAGVELRERIRSGDLRGPHMYTAGPIIDRWPTEEGLKGWSTEVTSEEEMRSEVGRQAKTGVDFIKLYRGLPRSLVAAGVDEAHRYGLEVVGHMGETTWMDSALAGIDMLVHSGWGTPMDEIVNLDDPSAASDREWYYGYADAPRGDAFAALVDVLKLKDVVVVPTLSITQASGLGKDASMLSTFQVELAPDRGVDNWWSDGWQYRHPQYGPDSEEEAELLATIYMPAVFGILRAYYEVGVRIGVGTDVGNSWMTPGFIYHHELTLYQEAGIPAMEILRMASYGGALALGLESDIGSIEVGKRADLILLRRDPSVDIRHTKDIEAVFLGGQLVSRRGKVMHDD